MSRKHFSRFLRLLVNIYVHTKKFPISCSLAGTDIEFKVTVCFIYSISCCHFSTFKQFSYSNSLIFILGGFTHGVQLCQSRLTAKSNSPLWSSFPLTLFLLSARSGSPLTAKSSVTGLKATARQGNPAHTTFTQIMTGLTDSLNQEQKSYLNSPEFQAKTKTVPRYGLLRRKAFFREFHYKRRVLLLWA